MNKELPLSSERCRSGGGDGTPKPRDRDRPAGDTGVCRNPISQPARVHRHQCRDSTSNLHTEAPQTQSHIFMRPVSTIDDKLPTTPSVDDARENDRALRSSSGRIAGGSSDKKVEEVRGGVANGICTPDKETSRLDSKGFKDQSTITDERLKDGKERRWGKNESKFYKTHRSEIDAIKTDLTSNGKSVELLKDFDPSTYSFTTVSSLETNTDNDGGGDDVGVITSHRTRRHSAFPNLKPRSENHDGDERLYFGGDNSMRIRHSPLKLKEIQGKHLVDDAGGTVHHHHQVKDGSRIDSNTCIGEVISSNSRSSTEFAGEQFAFLDH